MGLLGTKGGLVARFEAVAPRAIADGELEGACADEDTGTR